jgi:hypothetical protein
VSFSVSVALLEEDKEIEEREKRRRKGGEKEKGEKMDFFQTWKFLWRRIKDNL